MKLRYQWKDLDDDVETVKEFCYFVNALNASGGKNKD